MRASTAIPWIILIVLVFVSKLNAYTYSEFLNTDSGYCEGPSYGRIPVGDIGYDKENCERIECGRGVRHVAGCGKVMKPDDPRCRILQREGRYQTVVQMLNVTSKFHLHHKAKNHHHEMHRIPSIELWT